MSEEGEARTPTETSRPSWPRSESDYSVIRIDEPAPYVRRITLDRPEKRNARIYELRTQSLHALRAADENRDVQEMGLRLISGEYRTAYDA